MLNLFLPLLSFFAGNTKSFVESTTEQITLKVALQMREFLILIFLGVASLVLVIVGTSMFTVELANIFEQENELHWSASLSIFLSLTVVSAVGLYVSLKSANWQKAASKKINLPQSQPKESKPSSPIESAVALLIMDFVEERQANRTAKSSDSTDSANTNSPG